MVSTPQYRKELQRVKTGASATKRNSRDRDMTNIPNGTPTERTGLVSGRQNGGAGMGIDGHRKSSLTAFFEFFAQKNHTAGMESENKFVRIPALAVQATKVTLYSNYVNILLVFVPLGMVAGAMGWNSTVVFFLNFFAIVPLAAVLSFATEEISMKLGQTMGGLLNATFGNAVELIVSIVALKDGQIRIVQSSMLGSILSNMLLVLGCCFLAGGIHNSRTGTAHGIQQDFNSTVASTMSSLMTVAAASLIIPATIKERNILILSHGTAIILLILYVLYLFFQLRTHASLFDAETPEDEEEEEEEEPQLTPWAAGCVLLVVTIAVAICAEYLVGSIDALVESSGISKTFIGLILLPIVGNAAEHVTAIVVAVKDKMDLAMGVAIGSSMQIALLVTPALVLLGWVIGVNMTLHFETFETVVFFLSVLVVTYVIQDGKSNYLEGAMLLGLYIIISLAFLVYPDRATSDDPNHGDAIGDSAALVARSLGALVGVSRGNPLGKQNASPRRQARISFVRVGGSKGTRVLYPERKQSDMNKAALLYE
ncbi:manganese resistance 1 protein [Drepanopeziza brunnea f. sp. 'multigermtubi' MB_m1]|uniref:Vacuolar calcium ion transporter n=1 Tax=Marssonina brunnea f. sp. multigermtubi (strain MB_m1) TaxID=1072389 RepID=K1XGF1_MARBU|nr:manganese resistance 1 protein [Drepanopeziza brunnea f. sp. 'multigermtubi' MB_m1]EKD19898.1 manganese resistance 1 protein [Drepanopeziza brunnea f. sp. 'multigermtubi' MB_m1]